MVAPITLRDLILLMCEELLRTFSVVSLFQKCCSFIKGVRYLRHGLVNHLYESGFRRIAALVCIYGFPEPREFGIELVPDARERFRFALLLARVGRIAQDARGWCVSRIYFYEIVHERELRDLAAIKLRSEPLRKRARNEPKHHGMIRIRFRRRTVRMARDAIHSSERERELPEIDNRLNGRGREFRFIHGILDTNERSEQSADKHAERSREEVGEEE